VQWVNTGSLGTVGGSSSHAKAAIGINSVTAQSGFSTEYHLQAFGDATIQGEGYVSGRAIVPPALGLTTLASLESGIIGGGAPSLTWVGSGGMVLTASYRG